MQITCTSVGQQSFFISTLGSAKYIPEELSKLTVRHHDTVYFRKTRDNIHVLNAELETTLSIA